MSNTKLGNLKSILSSALVGCFVAPALAGGGPHFTETDVFGNVYTTLEQTGNYGILPPYRLLTYKRSASGTLVWHSERYSSFPFIPASIKVDSDFSVVIAGTYQNSGSSEAEIQKLNPDGTLDFTRTLLPLGQTSSFSDVAIDASGNIDLVGQSTRGTTGAVTGLVAQYDSTGVLKWQLAPAIYTYNPILHVAIDSGQNVYYLGQTYNNAGQRFVHLGKVGANGVSAWHISDDMGFGNNDVKQLLLDPAEVPTVVENSGRASLMRPHIRKYSPSTGRVVLNPNPTIQPLKVVDASFDSSGNLYIAGTMPGGISAVLKTNSLGTRLWLGQYNTGKVDTVIGSWLLSTGRIAVVGSYNGQSAAQILTFGADGNPEAFYRYIPAAGTAPDFATGVVADANDNLTMTTVGSFSGATVSSMVNFANPLVRQWYWNYNP